MPYTSMINITFGEERREAVTRQQKQSASAAAGPQQKLVFQNRTSRPVANGNSKQQQQQQQPVYKVLQHPRHLESSSSGHQGASQRPQGIRPPPVSLKLCFCSCIMSAVTCVLVNDGQSGELGKTWQPLQELC